MQAPSFYLPRPPFDLTPEKRDAFEQLFLSTPGGDWVSYGLPYPKWEYLSYLCETKELVLHGSQVLNIDEVEPRLANDIKAFSNQRAIYATTDGIWVIYFAIVDRQKYSPLSLFNSAFVLESPRTSSAIRCISFQSPNRLWSKSRGAKEQFISCHANLLNRKLHSRCREWKSFFRIGSVQNRPGRLPN